MPPSASAEELLDAFGKFDLNGDGIITKDEISHILMRPGKNSLKEKDIDELWAEWTARFDANGDGGISKDEISATLVGDDPDLDKIEELDDEASDSSTHPVQSGQVTKGSHITIDGRPCKVTEVEEMRPQFFWQKDRYHFTATDVFDGTVHELSVPTDKTVPAPTVRKKEYACTEIIDGVAVLAVVNNRSTSASVRTDIKVPEGAIGTKLKKLLTGDDNITVTVLWAMGEEKIVAAKKMR